MEKSPLVGTWSLVSCVAKTSAGDVSYPWGKNSHGLLSYTDDGYVFVTHMSMDQEQSTSGFESYCGKYVVDDNAVTHHIELCSMPAFLGSQQKRFFMINDDELSLTTEPVVADGVSHTAFLVWRKTSAHHI